jgi:inorganic pyrophosphatase
MVDQGEADDKIIAVAANDMSWNHINDINELPPHTLLEMRRFFEDYKALEHKEVVVNEFMGRDVAIKIVEESMKLYDTQIRKK